MATGSDCHHCGQAMREVESDQAAGSERAMTARPAAQQRYLCSQCGATRVSASLALDGAPFSFNPFDNYLAAAACSGEAGDAGKLRLRMPVAEEE